MAKIPFDIKYRDKIECGVYKVVTEDDEPARIICWDSTINKERPIIAIVFEDQIEQYKADGRYDNDYDTSNYDLFIVTPEPELSEFEKACMKLYNEGRDDGLSGDKLSNESLKESASELLAIAKKEIGTTFDKAGEYLRGRNDGIEYGKAEVLNDLPRWEPNQVSYSEEPILCNGNTILNLGLVHIHIDQLKKLPGFKEDEK